MNKAQLLALDENSSATLNELRQSQPEVFNQIQAKLAKLRKDAVLASFAGSSKELRDHLNEADLSLAQHPGRDLKETIVAALKSRRIEPKIAQEAAERIQELERSNQLTDPANLNLPIKDHPLLQLD